MMTTQHEPVQLDDLRLEYEYRVSYYCAGILQTFVGWYTKFKPRRRSLLYPREAVIVFELENGTEVEFQPKFRKEIVPTGRKRRGVQ